MGVGSIEGVSPEPRPQPRPLLFAATTPDNRHRKNINSGLLVGVGQRRTFAGHDAARGVHEGDTRVSGLPDGGLGKPFEVLCVAPRPTPVVTGAGQNKQKGRARAWARAQTDLHATDHTLLPRRLQLGGVREAAEQSPCELPDQRYRPGFAAAREEPSVRAGGDYSPGRERRVRQLHHRPHRRRVAGAVTSTARRCRGGHRAVLSVVAQLAQPGRREDSASERR